MRVQKEAVWLSVSSVDRISPDFDVRLQRTANADLQPVRVFLHFRLDEGFDCSCADRPGGTRWNREGEADEVSEEAAESCEEVEVSAPPSTFPVRCRLFQTIKFRCARKIVSDNKLSKLNSFQPQLRSSRWGASGKWRGKRLLSESIRTRM